MEMTTVYIIVGKKVRQAEANIRGAMIMVPSPHGPLYFQRPQWHESREMAESHINERRKPSG